MCRVVLLALLVAGLFAVAARPAGPWQSPGTTYRVYYPDSFLLAITGKSGLFSFIAGHRHAVLATEWSANISVDPTDLAASKASITVPVSSLVIDSEETLQRAGLESAPSPEDVRTIQQQMLSPEVLDLERYPEIQFTTTGIERIGADELRVSGTFQMHGHSRSVTFPMRYRQYETGGFGFSGDFSITQSNFGMSPQSVAGGTVKVEDEVRIRFQVLMIPAS